MKKGYKGFNKGLVCINLKMASLWRWKRNEYDNGID